MERVTVYVVTANATKHTLAGTHTYQRFSLVLGIERADKKVKEFEQSANSDETVSVGITGQALYLPSKAQRANIEAEDAEYLKTLATV